MPAAAHSSTAVSVTRPVCSSCGAQGDPGSVFCTECGKRLGSEFAPVVETAPTVAATVTPMSQDTPAVAAVDEPPVATAPAATLPTTFCISCGSKLEPRNGFCTNCGQPANGSSVAESKPAEKVATPTPVAEATRPVRVESAASSDTRTDAVPQAPIQSNAPSLTEVTPPAAVIAEPTVDQDHLQPAPQVAAPIYAAAGDYPPAQPGGSAFRVIVLVLLLLIIVGGLGGWYFMGVETVIVCSPPDVTVFLDDKELAPTSYGRYVVPHLSRRPHLLKVQRAGFADTIERLDFPFTSLHEWINIKLVSHRQTRPSR
jgi:uncharacterized OB-fold protein